MNHFALFFLALLSVYSVNAYGILRVEEIWSNLDTETVIIEEIIIKQSQMFVDYVEDVSLNGVTVEGVIFSNGAVEIPGNLTTTAGIRFIGPLFANGRITADAGIDSDDISFSIEPNTGNTFILGDVRAQGGINVVNGSFVMQGISGDTTIAQAFLRPNGGINVRDERFTATTNGTITSKGDAHFAEDVLFGTVESSDRLVTRIPSSEIHGGTTYFEGQNAQFSGGDLIVATGFSENNPGKYIFIGNRDPKTLILGRSALTNGLDGGLFTIGGQDSLVTNGGKVVVAAGNSFSLGGLGGNIILAPGLSRGSGRVGRVILGSTEEGNSGNDLIFGRRPLDFGNGGLTTFKGQNTLNGIGGNLFFRAGSVFAGIGEPGDLVISPGDTLRTKQGVVRLGAAVSSTLNIRREKVASAGGRTALTAGFALNGNGGNLKIVSGFGQGEKQLNVGTNGGDLFLIPGSSRSASAGNIYWGRSNTDLTVSRIPDTGSGRATFIRGQTSNAKDAAGGDMYVLAGNGLTSGGNLLLNTGSASTVSSGPIKITAGKTASNIGGDVFIRAGDGFRGNGGDIIIEGGIGDEEFGSIEIIAGSADSPLGNIILGPAIAAFEVGDSTLINQKLSLQIEDNNGDLAELVLSQDPDFGIVNYLGTKVLSDRQLVPFVDPFDTDNEDIVDGATKITQKLRNLISALATCGTGHWLFDAVDIDGNVVISCPSP